MDASPVFSREAASKRAGVGAEQPEPGERTGAARRELHAIRLGLCLFHTSGRRFAAETLRVRPAGGDAGAGWIPLK
jgi:hypothetical protein